MSSLDLDDGQNVTVVDPKIFRWMLPGERRLANWGTGRIRKVQGDSRQLVAGAYVILAAMWGSLGGIVGLVGIVLLAATKRSSAGPVLLIGGAVLIGIGVLRQVQSRNARRRGDP